ncbi:Sodium-dependent dicarboxylate transporter SdcS [Symmachiella dynata]|uniref:Sodium-dependent dicarboxylate transporter SdcS n=1 Tax=Symmachiella dynata TaxID=2527995 RepID=A0A517ZVY3_9PLAN|nr:SLC13 family permease [Symmachiella dynata]QDU46643.1 Sodium-dependent dicarboxylate transporter SdcS [Symmachiella dynata]
MSSNAYEAMPTPVGRTGLVCGPLLFLGVLFSPLPEGMSVEAHRLVAVVLWMVMWWVTQAVPIAATSLLPLALFPLLGIQPAKEVPTAYMNQSIVLAMGGFMIALGIERWGLHRRIAFHIVRLIGTGPRRIVLGFMCATAFLSMWISNTASTLLMLPIALAILTSLEEVLSAKQESGERPDLSRLSLALLLGIAYAASMGGSTTLVGTPTNIAFLGVWDQHFAEGPEITAGQWMMAFVPLGMLLIFCAWVLLTLRMPPQPQLAALGRGFFRDRIRELGPPTMGEMLMFGVFVMTACLWVLRGKFQFQDHVIFEGWATWLENWLAARQIAGSFTHRFLHDSTTVMAMVVLMFCLPGGRDEQGKLRFLMDWETASRLPWGLLLLFGGGFAIAAGFENSQLSVYFGTLFTEYAAGSHPLVMVLGICLLLTFLTEFTSNVATTQIFLPILGAAAVSLGIDPRLFMLPATVSTSCAFMLPIATPPNAIVFGSGRIRVLDMVRYGILLNLLGVLLITAVTYLLVIPIFGIDTQVLPSWAK